MTADEIRHAAIARRQVQGLKITLLTPEGPTTLYPKDYATKQAWIRAAQQRGYTLVDAEEGRCMPLPEPQPWQGEPCVTDHHRREAARSAIIAHRWEVAQ